MGEYEISNNTLAIIPIGYSKSKVLETTEEFIVNLSPFEIINNSCKYFGSSYSGRHDGTKNLIGVSHKAPIIIEETTELIFFPTMSPRIPNCYWISLNKVKDFIKNITNSKVIFENGIELELNISFNSLTNQILRATRLESVLKKRKEIIY
ncbi:MAG: competence protein ComK [Bacilli bacterium]